MATLKFDVAAVRRLMRHIRSARGGDPDVVERPRLVLVKDVGIYLMSDGTPRLLMADGNPSSSTQKDTIRQNFRTTWPRCASSAAKPSAKTTFPGVLTSTAFTLWT